METFCYRYDGTFAGFLTCFYESMRHAEPPACFFSEEDAPATLYPEREVVTDRERARQVYNALAKRISPEGQKLVADGFLTCLPEREMRLYEFLQLALTVGAPVMRRLTDDRVHVLFQAVNHARREAQLLLGFVRFSAFGPVLAGEISPKNRVLPMIADHFCDRFGGERFVLYDRTHREALFHEPGRRVIAPLEDFTLAAPDGAELTYRRLWKRFYDTIAIEGRTNPKCRMTHMPKRYWAHLTELNPALTEQNAPRLSF